MPFGDEVRNTVLLWADRHCCLCKKTCGINIVVHHLVPEAQNGGDDIDNAIPLCFECHGIVQHYNDEHPIGTKYKPDELKVRRDQVYEEFTRYLVLQIHYVITQTIPGSAGTKRNLPDVGFIVDHRGIGPPAQLKVNVVAKLDGESVGTPENDRGHYSGTKVWNLNPTLGVSGHFSLPESAVGKTGKLELVVDVTIIDVYKREHTNLPVSWVYMAAGNDWYFEPCPSL